MKKKEKKAKGMTTLSKKGVHIDKELCIVSCDGRLHEFNDPFTAWSFYKTVK